MSAETIPTNDVFKDLCLLLRLHKDKDYIIELFARKGWDVSKSKLHAWGKRAGEYNRDFRPMPEQALRDFIDALKEEKLIDDGPAVM
ncbi:DUF1456 family protein [Erwinia amylovora]|uniref:DUF1456 family protein n=1 Tax=Erwinia amylovora TaxID=552 RepID=UPI0014446B64|nr:DUF1456 family protein [Erwinia amylovora]